MGRKTCFKLHKILLLDNCDTTGLKLHQNESDSNEKVINFIESHLTSTDAFIVTLTPKGSA